MINQINADGVLPFAARRPYGVRQALFTHQSPRATISKILQPYRRLMNEIFQSPIAEYGEKVLEKVEEIEHANAGDFYGQLGLKTCLLVPVADAKPRVFLRKMFIYSQGLLRRNAEGIRSVIVESLTVQKERYPQFYAELEADPLLTSSSPN